MYSRSLLRGPSNRTPPKSPSNNKNDSSTRPTLNEVVQTSNLTAATSFNNLSSLLESRCDTNTNRSLVFYSPGHLHASPTTITYDDFFARVKRAANQILEEKPKPNSVFLIHFDNHHDNLLFWWAVVYAGHIPAMSTPLSNNTDQRRAHLLHLWSRLDDPVVLTRQKSLPDFSVQSALRIRTVEALLPARHGSDAVIGGTSKNGSDLACLMLTSGSTGQSKAVCLTHGLILKSILEKSRTHATGSETTFLNWVGADHVACLTEMHAHAFWAGGEQIYVEAADIIPDPLSFWRLCHKHQVNHSFAPHFFLASLYRALVSSDGIELRDHMKRLNLWTIVTGGEANVVDTCLALTAVLQEAGSPANCLKPAFGMTETSGGSIYSHVFPAHDVRQGYNFSSVGLPIDGLEFRIIDDDGRTIAPGSLQTGMLQVKGAIVFDRYYNDPKATSDAFDDGWFQTGDQGMVDEGGQLVLTGRAKELLIINGVNYTPGSVETILEGIEGTVSSYTLVLPFRPQEADTESLCVVYLPAYDSSDLEARDVTNNAISTAVLLQVGVRPLIIPLDATILQKSTLGKLPRNKIRKMLESGLFNPYDRANQEKVQLFRASQYEAPATPTEIVIIDTFLGVLNMKDLKLGATTNLFSVGINSINLIAIKGELQRKLGRDKIPTATIISSPTARELAAELDSMQVRREYNPMVTLQSKGDNAPLWLIHPGVGEVLVFLALAYHIKDRPVYAMRARGFEAGEPYFESVTDAVQIYYHKIREMQPHGPYALAGYSFGSMIAFEMAKLLRQTDEVKFLGVFNLPPHIKLRMRQLDWYNCLLHLSYFLNLLTEEYAHKIHPTLQQETHHSALRHVLSIAPPDRLTELEMDEDGLQNWTDLAYSLQSSATEYEPSGLVDVMDVFYAVPLAEVAKDMDDWLGNHLGKWEDFCLSRPRYHRVDGSHYTMISPAHVHTFQKTLKKALSDRDI